MPSNIPDLTDTQKLRMIPQLSEGVKELYTLIVTGDPKNGQPGMLESIRNIAKDITEIKSCQKNYLELERRILEIEKRHEIADVDKARIDEQKKKWNMYQLAIFGMFITNVGIIVMNILGFNK